MFKRRARADAVINVDLYKVKVPVFFTRDRLRAYFEEQGFVKIDDLDLDDPFAGRAYHIKDPEGRFWHGMIFPRESTHVSVVAHECLHVAHNVLSDLAIDSTYENDEHLAYLLEYLVKETTAVFKNQKTAKLEV